MSGVAEEALSFLQDRLPAYLEHLGQMCEIESPTSHKLGVDTMAEWVREWARTHGWDTRTWSDTVLGECVVVRLARGTGSGVRVLLVAHLDTVYPLGTVVSGALTRNGDVLLGPGTADNKSGLLSSLYAMAALAHLGIPDGVAEVSLFCGGDEETDMRRSGAVLAEIAGDFDVALVMEAGRENGDVVASRKGRGSFALEIRGKAAHAGVEPHRGANAIIALTQQMLALQLLNGARPGMTVNVGVISGGTLSNVVPDMARAEVDIRVARPEDRETVSTLLRELSRTTYVPGTTCRIEGDWVAPPMPRTSATARLVALAQSCAAELGFSIGAAETGGMSYANLLAGMGVPVLDGLGPVGGLDHSPDEYILISSIVPRTALLSLMVLRVAQEVNIGQWQTGTETVDESAVKPSLSGTISADSFSSDRRE